MYSTLTFTHTTQFNGHNFTVEINYVKCMPGRIQSITAKLNNHPSQEFNPACLNDLLSLLADPILSEIKTYLYIEQ